MAALLSSNVARLVLSYLCEEQLDQTYLSLCESSKYLTEERDLFLEKGLKSINQCSLVEILSDHSRSKFLVDQFIKELPNSSNFLNQNTFIFDKLAFIVETVRPLLLPPRPQSMRKRPRVDSTEDANLPKRCKLGPTAYTTIYSNVSPQEELPVGTVEHEEIFPMFSDTLLNNMSLQAEFIENINRYAVSSNLNSSLNVDTERIIQDTVRNPLYEELVEHVVLNSTVAQKENEEYEQEYVEEEAPQPEPHQSQTTRRKSKPKKMETSTPYPEIEEPIKRRLRQPKSKSPVREIVEKVPNTRSVKKKASIKKENKINVISNEKIEPQYQQLIILDQDNNFGYVTVPITNLLQERPSVENIANNNQNIISIDPTQINPTPQIIVLEDLPPIKPLIETEEKKIDEELMKAVNKTPKATILFNKSMSQSTPRRSHVRALNFSTVPKVHKSTPKTIGKCQSLNKTSKRLELSGDEDDNLMTKPVLSLIEENSSSMDCNQTVIENTISKTPRAKGNARKCVRVLSRSGSENGGDEGGESSCKDDEKKDAATLEWEAQRKLTTKNFDQHLRNQQQPKLKKEKIKKKIEKVESEGEKEIPEKFHIKYPTPKKTKTPKKKLKTKKNVKKVIEPETETKVIEPVPKSEIIGIIPLTKPIENEPVIEIDPKTNPVENVPITKPVENEPVIESVIIPLIITTEPIPNLSNNSSSFNEPIGFEISPDAEPIRPNPIQPSHSCNISSLLETPYKFDPIGIPSTPQFLVPQVQDTPITKIMNQFKTQGASLIKDGDIQTPIFPITPGSNTTPPISPTVGCYNRPTDYSSSSSYYKPDETDNLSGRSIRRDSDRNSDYEEIIDKVKAQQNEQSPVKMTRRKKSYFPEPEEEVKETITPVIDLTSFDPSNQSFRTPVKDSSCSDSSESEKASDSSSSDSDESSPEKQPIVSPEKLIVEENFNEKLMKQKAANDLYEEKVRQHSELEEKRLRIMKKIVAEPPKPTYLSKKQHILARKISTKTTKFISPSKRKSTNPGKLIYLEETPAIRTQRLKNVKKDEKISKPTVSDISDNAVQSDVLVEEHFTKSIELKDSSGEESLDLIQKHLDSKLVASVIDEVKDDSKQLSSDLIAELEGEMIETNKKTAKIEPEPEQSDEDSDESDDFYNYDFCSGSQIEMKHDLKFKCSEKQQPLDFKETSKIMFGENEFCRISFGQPINIYESSPPVVKRRYNKRPPLLVNYSFANKNKNKTPPNAKFNLKQKTRPGTSSNDGEINSVLDLIHGSK